VKTMAIALGTVLIAGASTQGDQHRRLEWEVRWSDAQWVAGRELILGNPLSVPVTVVVANDGNEVADVAEPAEALRVVVREGPPTGDLAVSCHSATLGQRNGPSEAVPVGRAVLSPGEVATFVCSVARADGTAFVSGRYSVDVAVDWPAARRRQRGTWKLEIRPPETASEVTRLHLVEGSKAMPPGGSDVPAAIRHFEAAVAASPDAFWPLNSLAAAYDAAGRRADAIAVRELALQKPGAIAALRESRVPELLARAHLLNGDPASARRVLRLVGRPEERIEAFIRGGAPPRK